MRVHITLKSGAVVKFRAAHLDIKRNAVGTRIGIEWRDARGFLGWPVAALEHVDIDEVAAVVVKRWRW